MSQTPAQAILALGGNLGDRADNMRRALLALHALAGTRVMAISDAWDTDPVGPAGQPTYLNFCTALETTLPPHALLTACLNIETSLGRVRTERNGPRTCDIDLLFYGQVQLDEPGLTLPHPRWASRGFVVFPLRHLLQMRPLASAPDWDWLRVEAARAEVTRDGLRPWTGPTPWMTTQP